MAIVINLDVMMAKRKIGLTELAGEVEEAGIEEGDTVRMYGLEFDYYK